MESNSDHERQMASSESSDSRCGIVEKRKGRKRLRYPEQWKRKRQKIRKDGGKSYDTYKGERMTKKNFQVIICRCQNRCNLRVSRAERKRIFHDFYKLSDHDNQNKYLFGLIKRSCPKRTSHSAKRARVNIFIYHVRLSNGDNTKVCKQAFCQIHGITKRRVEKLCTKLVSGVLFSGDNRGKHKNRPHSISDELKAQVRDHINSFPSRESHYSRQDNRTKKYLNEGLSIARMHRLYLQKYEPDRQEKQPPQLKEWLYRKIFNEDFNISFGYPRSDTCETCDLLKTAIDSEKSEDECCRLQVELATHQEAASRGYQSIRLDTSKDDPDNLVLTFDMQQTLPVPTLTHGSMFYLRQLWVYNFGIHECSNESAVMCLWNECIAGRGSSEMISCLMEYFTHKQTQTKKLTCYSDSCFGQNKNTNMICFWAWLILQGKFIRIDHKFLVRGHTYLPCDRDFAHIEKRKGSAVIHLPADWEKVIKEACPSKPFCVQNMNKEKFRDFSQLSKKFTLRKKDTDGHAVLISTASWFNFGEGEDGGKIVSHPSEFWMKSTLITEDPWQKVCILKGRKKLTPPKDIDLPIAHPNGHPMNPKKVADLQKMVPFLPSSCKEFYMSLSNHPVSNSDETDAN